MPREAAESAGHAKVAAALAGVADRDQRREFLVSPFLQLIRPL